MGLDVPDLEPLLISFPIPFNVLLVVCKSQFSLLHQKLKLA